MIQEVVAGWNETTDLNSLQRAAEHIAPIVREIAGLDNRIALLESADLEELVSAHAALKSIRLIVQRFFWLSNPNFGKSDLVFGPVLISAGFGQLFAIAHIQSQRLAMPLPIAESLDAIES